ncbi:CBS domain-containing protein [Streptomyces acidiscabies]|uniref:CBS domain-containing protein n=1 Tax=Streptomyces acidiscabies TaxID=42234 RepID=A0AAP6EDQ4_9ACTN|nr:CBS domain-containing protein [Streptomyces acidiscabies]MBZ3911190.1 CBS domain-containing protein [Streptomyces acidiscabies]MDX2959028.1 CBS domain-containing protein [Streptomyces acidiscabies]MDX3023876.1 CBS domain-containing protein [Streptomyces acidiscabies]MDX3788303.1 CBS domain-containing protein [Streptomyces acidiscabies]GAV40238.1 CBS domain protein [Streptomyces acidiscabies]
MRAWVVRAGENGERERTALDAGLLIVGWHELGDLSSTVTREDVKSAVAAAYPDEGSYTIGNWTGQLHRFVHEIRPGDLVVLPLRSLLVAVGRVTGSYEYRPDAIDETHHVRRVEWTVTDIDRKTIRSDLLDSMGSLLTVFELTRFGAADRVALLAQGEPDPGRPDADEFAATLTEPAKLYEEVRGRAADRPVTLSIRDFLAVWGAQRRYPAVTERIENDLEARGLVTVPPFTEGTLDSRIAVLAGGAEPGESGTSVFLNTGAVVGGPLPHSEAETPAVAYLVSNLDSANRPPESVQVGDSLETAMTLMVLRGYSQLPVLDASGRLSGVVSWESIGKARMAELSAGLKAATVRGQEADLSDDLLTWVETIQQSGYVVVRDHDHKVCGLITAADLTVQFGTRVRPFVLVEEIEQRLRRVIDRCIPLDRIREIVPPRRAPQVQSAADLTFGHYGRLLRDPMNWAAVAWAIDQQHFLAALEVCRNFRNDLMHFSPDPITDDQLLPVQGLLALLRSMDPQV